MKLARLRVPLALLVLAAICVAVPALWRREKPRPPADTFLTDLRLQLRLQDVLPAEAAVVAAPQAAPPRLALAQACSAAGDPVGAALALYPLLDEQTEPQTRLQFVDACISVGWLEEAVSALKPVAQPPAGVRLRLAGAYTDRGLAAKAVPLLAQLEQQPLSPHERVQGIGVWLRCRRPERALAWAREAAALQPSGATAAVVARCYLALDQPEAARSVLVQAVGEQPEDPVLAFWLGRAEVRSKDPKRREAGRARLEHVATTGDGNRVAAFEAGQAALAAGDAERAIPLLETAQRAGYQEVLCYDALARAYATRGRRAEAAWVRGKAQSLRGQLPAAQASFRASLAAEPASARYAVDLAQALSSEHKITEALAVVERAQRGMPGNVDVALLKAAILGRLERVQEQAATLEHAATLDPARANEAWGNLGKSLYESQQFDRATVTLKRAVDAEPGDALAHMYLGLTYARHTEDPEQGRAAVRHLLQAAQDTPAYHYPWMNAGSVLQTLNLPAEAAATYRAAIHGDNRWEGPYLSLAQVLQRQGRVRERELVLRLYGQARELEALRVRLENAVKARRADPAAHLELGDRLLRDGRTGEALRELLLAASLRPGWKAAQARLADACALLGYEDLYRAAQQAAR